MLSTNEIRTKFIEYFKSKKHATVQSSSLVPHNDKTLLFTNAGMVQFKDVFLGSDKRNYSRAVSSQKCVRAGGKHNDLENVGYTARHHTFFEMLGNFSFGDYFKRDAIKFAWEFLTEELKLPKEKLWITVFEEDDEAEEIWVKEIGVPKEKVSRIGAKDNFWQMGDTGPCGPCSEVFYDHGSSVAGGPPGTPEEDGDRYIEIWNLVFMQFNRQADGTLENLPNPSVDTGMGLERIAAILQDKHNNYDIDLFQSLIKFISNLLKVNDLSNPSLKVIADHIRSCSFLIADGVIPSNEGRGYVLRRIIRRAARHGYKLGAADVFFYKVVDVLVKEMGQAFPELVSQQKQIENHLKREEQQFSKTLDHGMKLLSQAIDDNTKQISGELAFKLYDTYGFPIDLTLDIARERSLNVDIDGFDKAMQVQKNMAKSASSFGIDYNKELKCDDITDFKGYTHSIFDAKVTSLFKNGELTEELNEGDEAALVLDTTPFYAESGGQVGDVGLIESHAGSFKVIDTQKSGNAFVHFGEVIRGTFSLEDEVTANIEFMRRKAIARNHSATHLLHAALRKVVGTHVEQKGSLVDDQRLRFDFASPEAVSKDLLREVEQMVNAAIRLNMSVETIITSNDHAQQLGAMALFGEKYGDTVRVLRMGDFSIELCGGTHVSSTGEIGYFKIISESGIASGIRRIEAVTALGAEGYVVEMEELLGDLGLLLKSKHNDLKFKLEKLLGSLKEKDKEIKKLQQDLLSGASQSAEEVRNIGEIKVITNNIPNADIPMLREQMDKYKSQNSQSVIVLAAEKEGKVSLIIGVTKDITNKLKAGDLVKTLAPIVGGKGGGRPDMAQAGGTMPLKINNLFSEAHLVIEKMLA
ncbi:alanine--tRNA ligase [Francisellaceae bacterium]|nr:alanine--tRNA ligase [Francisellaceae bacterium]